MCIQVYENGLKELYPRTCLVMDRHAMFPHFPGKALASAGGEGEGESGVRLALVAEMDADGGYCHIQSAKVGEEEGRRGVMAVRHYLA